MSRRLRLVLLLAAIAAAGPSAVTLRAAHATDAHVSIAWRHVSPVSRPQRGHPEPATPVVVATRATAGAPPQHALPDGLRAYSLFQRPPPVHA